MSRVPMIGMGALLGPKLLLENRDPDYRLPSRPWVIHVREKTATFWDFSTGWYGYHVDQSAVDAMVARGLNALTGSTSTAQAWSRLIPGFVTGQKIAIKVNFNNFQAGGPDPDSDINALIEPVNAVIGTLVDFGVAPGDITVYDVTHGWHDGGMPKVSFIDRCLFPGVRFVAYVGNPDPFSASEKVVFNCPAPPKPQIPDLAICRALAESDYLINMPLVKAHPYGYVTLGFKHHFGSIDTCYEAHSYLPYFSSYVPTYSPLVDIFKNPHFGAKTVLTVGDALFGNWLNVSGAPRRWITFENLAPSSLFFSNDPVAIDSVMADFVDWERQAQGYGPLPRKTRDFLLLAEAEGLGIHDSGDPDGSLPSLGYSRIQYAYIEGVV